MNFIFEAFNLIILVLVREWYLTIMLIIIMILIYYLLNYGPVIMFKKKGDKE